MKKTQEPKVMRYAIAAGVAGWAIFAAVPAHSSDALTKSYHAAIEKCAFDSVMDFDDKATSADIVGRALIDQCHATHHDLWTKFRKENSKSYVDGYVEAQLKWATGLVLYVRAHADDVNKQQQ